MADKAATMKIVLKKPIPFEEQTLTELTLRTEITAGDLMAGDGHGEVGKLIHIVAALAAVPPSTIKAMAAVDFMRVSEKLGPLLGAGLPTQGT